MGKTQIHLDAIALTPRCNHTYTLMQLTVLLSEVVKNSEVKEVKPKVKEQRNQPYGQRLNYSPKGERSDNYLTS